MRAFSAAGLVLLALLALSACGGDSTGIEPTPRGGEAATPTATSAGGTAAQFQTQRIAGGFARPTFVTSAGDGSNRLFVLEKPGRVRIIKGTTVLDQSFLDITSLVGSSGNEQGLLGLAFHPDFEKNGRFWVTYTAKNAANTLAEYRVSSPGSNTADASSGKVLFAVPDQFPNHNGGMLAFGPDGYLYVSMGDGGSAGDPNGNGQNLSALLAKLLRIDINSGDPYAIPDSNPFAKRSDARKEVWAYGLRNPWRFTFDRKTGDIWIGDVGQNKYEEVDFQAASSKGGENYGWNTTEGLHCYKPETGCNQDGLVKPVFEYSHDAGCSVTGGYVYRGTAIPALAGKYLFTDYCTPTFWATTRDSTGKFTTVEIGKLRAGITSFGEDEAGELLFTVDQEGAVYRLMPK